MVTNLTPAVQIDIIATFEIKTLLMRVRKWACPAACVQCTVYPLGIMVHPQSRANTTPCWENYEKLARGRGSQESCGMIVNRGQGRPIGIDE